MEQKEDIHTTLLLDEARELITELEWVVKYGNLNKIYETKIKIIELKEDVEELECYYWGEARKYPHQEILRLIDGFLERNPTMCFVQALLELKIVYKPEPVEGYSPPFVRPDRMVLKRMKRAEKKFWKKK